MGLLGGVVKGMKESAAAVENGGIQNLYGTGAAGEAEIKEKLDKIIE